MSAEAGRPNVLLIMTDQHRADALGFMGSGTVRTPHLDRLARRGVVFENAFTQSPVCMASRAAIHTGRYPSSLRIRSMGLLPPTETTLAESLKRAGYRTGLFGKLHFTPQQYTLYSHGIDRPVLDAGFFLADAGIDTPANRAALEDPCKRDYGFDVSAGVEDFLPGHYLDWLAERSSEHLPWAIGENFAAKQMAEKFGVVPEAAAPFPDQLDDGYDSRLPAELHPSWFIVERTLEFARANRDRPFFAHCSFVDPHHPFNAPTPFSRMYPPDEMPVPPPLDRAACFPPGLPDGVRAQIDGCAAFPAELWQWVIANYYGMVSHVDHCVGRLLDGLERLGLLDDTLVVFIADHGEYAGDHRLLRKGSLLFDSLMRAPFTVTWPARLAGGRRVDAMVREIDVYPTIMSLLGLPVHAGVQGRDLTPTLRGEEQPGCERVYCGLDALTNPIYTNPCYAPSQAVRSAEWKLNYFPLARTGMVFNLVEDPGETRNLYFDPAHADVRHELMMDLLDHHHTAKDPLPLRLSQA